MSETPEKIEQKGAEKKSYLSILKATILFGGVQVFLIIIGVIKNKFIAVLLGPAGMGMQGLYQSALNFIKSFSSMGLDRSAVRDVSEANGQGDIKQVSRTVSVLRRLVWFTGILGIIVTILLSPILSKISFGNYDYSLPFIILSVTLLINQISSGQSVVLQGMRRLKDLAKALTLGATLGLIVSIPLYYFLRIDGIIPTLILNSLTSLLLSWYFARKIPLEKVWVSTKESLREGRTMLKMGIAMSIASMLEMFFAFILRGYISNTGGLDQVGIFTAGHTVMNVYVAMVFTAMAKDYYPRLSAVNKDNDKCREMMNQQGEVGLLIITPILVICIILMPVLVSLLYSDKFILATDFILWGTLGMLFKMVSWLISYSFLAKADSKTYVISEAIASTYMLGFNILGYHFGGLKGLGIAFIVDFFVYALQVYIIAHKKNDFIFGKQFIRMFLMQFAFILVTFVIMQLSRGLWAYIVTSAIFAVCTIYSIRELNKRTDIRQYLLKKINHGK